MFGSEMLEVLIGIIFVFLVVSMICSTIRESIEAWFKSRAAFLERGIRELLHDPAGTGLARSVFRHPLIYGLYAGDYAPCGRVRALAGGGSSKAPSPRPGVFTSGGTLPSYIPARTFALALMDIVTRGPNAAAANSGPQAPVLSADSMRASLLNVESPEVRRALLTAIDSAQGDLEKVRQALEAWYDGSMDRVSGWYRRSTQWALFWIGLAIALVMNVNTITIVDYLYRNDTARAALVARAETAATDTAFLRANYDEARRELESLALPIGWAKGWGAPRQLGDPTVDTGWSKAWNFGLGPILGWLLTAFAATLGAPFWFDLLNKFMVIRSTVKPHEKSPEEASEDRQPARRRAPVQEGDGAQPRTGEATSHPSRPAPSSAAAPVSIGDQADAESDVDGCAALAGTDGAADTADEDLPAATGGVA